MSASTLAAQDTVHRGMGALPHAEGTEPRLWAPHARQVFVKGDFNDWSDTANALEQEGNGYCYADGPGARPDHGYKFRLVTPDAAFERIDPCPYTREVTHASYGGAVHDVEFDWEGDDFTLPPHNELVIYEMQIGSFNPENGDQPGNFCDAVEKLGYLKRLGINAIQVMPVAEFAGDYSWGYNPAIIFAVESACGGPAAFKTFIREAHRNGIAVNPRCGLQPFRAERSPFMAIRRLAGKRPRRHLSMMWLEDYHVDGLRFDSDASSCSADFGNYPSADVVAQSDPKDGLAARGSVAIAPYSALIYCLPAVQPSGTQ